jgi:hypothetical protein
MALFAGRGRPGSTDMPQQQAWETACPQAVLQTLMDSQRQCAAQVYSFLLCRSPFESAPVALVVRL